MKSRICVTTYVTGKEYQEFIPVFIYSLYKAYPEYDVLIFCGEELAPNVRKSLDHLRNHFDFRVVENHLNFEPQNLTRRVSSMSKRWLLYEPEFSEYECVYIGDIDIFILEESPGLVEQHLTHCETIGLDYSNIRRRSHSNRVSGLHFVKGKGYFENMVPVIEKYTDLMKADKLTYENSCEYMLYDMIEEAGLGLCPRAVDKNVLDPKAPAFRPEHGVHLAVFRDLFVKKRKVTTVAFDTRMQALQNVIDDPVFKEIENNFQAKMIKRIFKRVHKFTTD